MLNVETILDKLLLILYWILTKLIGWLGHDKVRLGQVLGHFIPVCPLWAYAENLVEIHQDLAEI